jgi:hypothetical protein
MIVAAPGAADGTQKGNNHGLYRSLRSLRSYTQASAAAWLGCSLFTLMGVLVSAA